MTRKIKLTIPEGVENHFKKWAVVHTQWENRWGIVTKVESESEEVFHVELQTLSRFKWFRLLQIKKRKKASEKSPAVV